MAQSSSAPTDITRIQIERVEDWNRIRGNFTDAMLNTLTERLAKSSSQHVRDAVTAHLLQWRDRTFDSAKENLRVNGHNLEDYIEEQEETEPFDEVLDRRIWTLSTERMSWDKELAERRRTAPADIQYLVEDLLVRQRTVEYIPPPIEEQMVVDFNDARLAREAEVAGVFKQTMSILEDLQTKTPRILERTVRALEVEEEMRNLPA